MPMIVLDGEQMGMDVIARVRCRALCRRRGMGDGRPLPRCNLWAVWRDADALCPVHRRMLERGRDVYVLPPPG